MRSWNIWFPDPKNVFSREWIVTAKGKGTSTEEPKIDNDLNKRTHALRACVHAFTRNSSSIRKLYSYFGFDSGAAKFRMMNFDSETFRSRSRPFCTKCAYDPGRLWNSGTFQIACLPVLSPSQFPFPYVYSI